MTKRNSKLKTTLSPEAGPTSRQLPEVSRSRKAPRLDKLLSRCKITKAQLETTILLHGNEEKERNK